jgi:hypothetical protein
MRKKTSISLIVLLILFVGCFTIPINGVPASYILIANVVFPQPSGTTPPAIYTTLHEELSPDKTWDAKLYQAVYQGDYPFQTAIIVRLQLRSISHPAKASDVFSYDTGGNSIYNPNFSWTKPHALIISTLNTQYMTLHITSYSNVSISYKYHSLK